MKIVRRILSRRTARGSAPRRAPRALNLSAVELDSAAARFGPSDLIDRSNQQTRVPRVCWFSAAWFYARGSMREVLIKNTMKSWGNCFSGCRVAQARIKAIRTFNGRLRAFILIFQHRRKQLRQERASTLLANFPLCLTLAAGCARNRGSGLGRMSAPASN